MLARWECPGYNGSVRLGSIQVKPPIWDNLENVADFQCPLGYISQHFIGGRLRAIGTQNQGDFYYGFINTMYLPDEPGTRNILTDFPDEEVALIDFATWFDPIQATAGAHRGVDGDVGGMWGRPYVQNGGTLFPAVTGTKFVYGEFGDQTSQIPMPEFIESAQSVAGNVDWLFSYNPVSTGPPNFYTYLGYARHQTVAPYAGISGADATSAYLLTEKNTTSLPLITACKTKYDADHMEVHFGIPIQAASDNVYTDQPLFIRCIHNVVGGSPANTVLSVLRKNSDLGLPTNMQNYSLGFTLCSTPKEIRSMEPWELYLPATGGTSFNEEFRMVFVVRSLDGTVIKVTPCPFNSSGFEAVLPHNAYKVRGGSAYHNTRLCTAEIVFLMSLGGGLPPNTWLTE